MTPVEKIYTEESTNKEVMILRPEGKFYRLYERSAFEHISLSRAEDRFWNEATQGVRWGAPR